MNLAKNSFPFFSLQKGFTLIEILVSITILLLIVGGGIAAYTRFNDRQQLVQSAKNMQSSFRLAQKKSRAGDKPEACNRLEGYSIQGNSGESVLQVFANCKDGTKALSSTIDLVGESTTLSQDVDLVFHVLSKGVTGTTGDIVIESNFYAYSMRVTEGGEISLNDFVEK